MDRTSFLSLVGVYFARVITAGLLLIIGLSTEASIIGTWNGKLSVRGIELPVVLHFNAGEDSIPICTMDSPAQSAKDIPVDVVFLSDDSVRISAPKLLMSYSGRYDADSICGVFTQGFTRLPLTMVRGDIVLNRPQEPKAPFPYSVEEVAFDNPSGNATLAGSLVIPDEGVAVNGLPVVIMVSGSGQQNRDEELLGHKPFLVISDYLARHGIASLRYDDRGFAASTGDASQATTADFRNDARAGIEWLRRDGRFGKVGLIGHSEGGLIGYMLASAGDVDFAVSLAGPSVRGDSLLMYQNFELLRPSVGDTIAANYCAAFMDALGFVAASADGIPKDKAKSEVDRIMAEKTFTLPASLESNLVSVIEQTSKSLWLRFFLTFDPGDEISAIDVPVMAVVGSLDRQVPAEPTMAAVSGRLTSEGSVTRVYPGLNHMFQHAATGMTDEYGKIEETISEEVLADIVSFIEAAASTSSR